MLKLETLSAAQVGERVGLFEAQHLSQMTQVGGHPGRELFEQRQEFMAHPCPEETGLEVGGIIGRREPMPLEVQTNGGTPREHERPHEVHAADR